MSCRETPAGSAALTLTRMRLQRDGDADHIAESDLQRAFHSMKRFAEEVGIPADPPSDEMVEGWFVEVMDDVGRAKALRRVGDRMHATFARPPDGRTWFAVTQLYDQVRDDAGLPYPDDSPGTSWAHEPEGGWGDEPDEGGGIDWGADGTGSEADVQAPLDFDDLSGVVTPWDDTPPMGLTQTFGGQSRPAWTDRTTPVFVYGSLKLGLHNHRVIADHWGYGDTAEWDDAALHDVGVGFPYADDGDGTVSGEVFWLAPGHEEQGIQALDWLEGHRGEADDHYRRELRPIRLNDGSTVKAWVYLTNRPCRPISDRTRITTGIWRG